MNYVIALICGYGFAVVVGHLCIATVVDGLWRGEAGSPSDGKVRSSAYLSRLVGFVERALFVATLQMGRGELIGVWLLLKVAGQWKRWTEGEKVRDKVIDGRSSFNIFLIGSGLSIAYAFVGAQLIRLIIGKDWWYAIGLPVGLLLATLLLQNQAKAYQSQRRIDSGSASSTDAKT
jgi:hypothetical protein